MIFWFLSPFWPFFGQKNHFWVQRMIWGQVISILAIFQTSPLKFRLWQTAIFATVDARYLDNGSSFFNSVSGSSRSAGSIIYVKTENWPKSTSLVGGWSYRFTVVCPSDCWFHRTCQVAGRVQQGRSSIAPPSMNLMKQHIGLECDEDGQPWDTATLQRFEPRILKPNGPKNDDENATSSCNSNPQVNWIFPETCN